MTAPWFFGSDETAGPRFGLQFADGRKVFVQRPSDHNPLHVEPDHPTLRPLSGSGGEHVSRADMWLWPLPPAGPLTFVCAWPDDRPLPPSEEAVVI
jgi:hypothetical protein